MNEARLGSTFLELCRLPSPSRREGRLAGYIRRRAADFGLEVFEDDAARKLGGECGNLVVRTPAARAGGGFGGQPFFLAAHLDTVEVPFADAIPVLVEGGRVHTGGACALGADDKAGVAAILELLELAAEKKWRGRPFEAVFTVGEELGGLGAAAFDPGQIRARQGFNLDGETPVYSAITYAPTKLRYTIEVHGRRAHAAVEPEAGINALQAAGLVMARLPGGRLDQESTANVGLVEGGGPTNVVPDLARIVGELRSLDPALLAAWRAHIEKTAGEAAAERGARAALGWEQAYAGYAISADEPCARSFGRACQALGRPAAWLSSIGGGDANHFNAKGMRCVVVGFGMENIHSPDESYRLENLFEAVRLLEQVLDGNAP